MTGILNFQNTLLSGINNFDNISNDELTANLSGFTEDEIRKNF